MSTESVIWSLIQMEDSKIISIIRAATRAYGKILHAIINDIYESCIEDYYAGYTPTVYKRHGNLEGFNLYSAPTVSFNNGRLIFDEDPSKLLPYSGKTDSRGEVLHNVLNGLRGTGMRESQTEWPMGWYTSYPNAYSRYGIWQSSGHTIEEITQDFANNVLDDTEDLFWECVGQFI